MVHALDHAATVIGGEIESTKENIQDWIELDEGDPGSQLARNRWSHIMLFIFISTIFIIKFHIY
jgi:hypothetical protein